MQLEEVVEFKGSKEGLQINIKECVDIEVAIKGIKEKIESAINFFKGAPIVKIQGVRDEDKEKIAKFLFENYGIEYIKPKEVTIFQDLKEGRTKFVKLNLRSGGYVEYDGNLVIIGDINPGAEVVATGNIMVMGNLRGVAHAGSDGNSEAMVVAYHLDPIQLRIADHIAIPPEDSKDMKPEEPELAYVKNGQIVIETYLLKK